MDKATRLVKELGFNRIKLEEPLAPYTYMKVGGPAEILYESTTKDELADSVILARNLDIPYTIIGQGANILVADKGVRGLVIINKGKSIRFLANDYIDVESGVSNVLLVHETTERGYTGMERMVKVPGTVGGAIFMNAGHTAKMEFFGDLAASVEILNGNNEVKKVLKKDCGFAYRTSRFQTSGEVILSSLLHLQKVNKSVIEENVRDLLVIKQLQPAGPSVGSTFRNPTGTSAGRLIDQAGLKGTQIGGAKISEKHANFILNTGTASAADVKQLIELMRSSVEEKYHITLEEEVRFLGEWE